MSACPPPPPRARLLLFSVPDVSHVWPDISDWMLDRRRAGHRAGADDSGRSRRCPNDDLCWPLCWFVPLLVSFEEDRRRRREKRFSFLLVVVFDCLLLCMELSSLLPFSFSACAGRHEPYATAAPPSSAKEAAS